MMCRVYGLTRAGYYAWRSRGPSQHAQENAALKHHIKQVHQASRGTYGSPRVYRQLQQQGVVVGENRVAKLMQSQGIKGRGATLLYLAQPEDVLRQPAKSAGRASRSSAQSGMGG